MVSTCIHKQMRLWTSVNILIFFSESVKPSDEFTIITSIKYSLRNESMEKQGFNELIKLDPEAFPVVEIFHSQ